MCKKGIKMTMKRKINFEDDDNNDGDLWDKQHDLNKKFFALLQEEVDHNEKQFNFILDSHEKFLVNMQIVAKYLESIVEKLEILLATAKERNQNVTEDNK